MCKKYFLFCLFCISITTMDVSCKKGDTGPAGPQGTQGMPGIVGAAGADGSVIYSGTATPSATLGKNGDYYLNLTTGILYGPRTASGWGTGFTMKGAQGTQIYNGTGAPASSFGATGDYYMDTVAHDLYGPKQSAGWGNPVSLTGPAGANGTNGTNGANGSTIQSGTGAPAPSIGAIGDFYIDLAAGMLYGPKTVSGWGAGVSLKGANGTNGSNGTKIYAGTGVPAPALGAIGDFYMDTVTHNLYGPKLTAGWGLAIALQGATGTANVQYTPWFTSTGWSAVSNGFGININFYNKAVPALTSDIVNNGTILVYGRLNDYNQSIWPTNSAALLPITVTYIFSGTTYLDSWQAQITPGNIRLWMTDDHNFLAAGSLLQSSFRIVIIPGGVSIPANIGYKELQQLLHVNMVD